MPDNFVEACQSKLKIDATTVRNITRISRNKSVNIRKFGTSSTDCAKVAVKGTKDITITFDVILSEEEDIEDLIDVGDEVTIVVEYRLPDASLYRSVSTPVVIESMSDEINISDGGEITVTVNATSNGDETIT
jgi:hypothetical protein